MNNKEFKKLPYEEMNQEIRNELSKILIYTALINLIGWFAILIFGWKIGIFIGLITLLIVLLLIEDRGSLR